MPFNIIISPPPESKSNVGRSHGAEPLHYVKAKPIMVGGKAMVGDEALDKICRGAPHAELPMAAVRYLSVAAPCPCLFP